MALPSKTEHRSAIKLSRKPGLVRLQFISVGGIHFGEASNFHSLHSKT